MKKLMQICFWKKKYSLIFLEFFILKNLIYDAVFCIYFIGVDFFHKLITLILKNILQIEFEINHSHQAIYQDKNLKDLKKVDCHIKEFFIDNCNIILNLFLKKISMQVMFKNISLISFFGRFKRIYFVTFVDFFYRQEKTITRIFLAYFYNLFYINCQN